MFGQEPIPLLMAALSKIGVNQPVTPHRFNRVLNFELVTGNEIPLDGHDSGPQFCSLAQGALNHFRLNPTVANGSGHR